VTVSNAGANVLHVDPAWTGTPAADFQLRPSTGFDLAPGASRELELAVTPTALGSLASILELRSNDPAHASVALPVSARGVRGAGAGVVTARLDFASANDGYISSDVRRVDLSIESPDGQRCDARHPSCDFGPFGRAAWSGQGSLARPQGITLQGATTDGTYRLAVRYTEDCEALPTASAANFLGLSVEALLAYFLDEATLLVDASDVSFVVSNLCMDREPTVASVVVSVDGRVVQERALKLQRRGEESLAFEVVRTGSVVNVRQ